VVAIFASMGVGLVFLSFLKNDLGEVFEVSFKLALKQVEQVYQVFDSLQVTEPILLKLLDRDVFGVHCLEHHLGFKFQIHPPLLQIHTL